MNGHILMMLSNSSTSESAIHMTDGRRLLKLRYREAAAAAEVACELIARRATVASFLCEFGVDETSIRDFSRGLCIDIDRILDEVGGNVVDPAEWNDINVRILRDDVRRKCGGDQTLTTFIRTLGNILPHPATAGET